MAEIVFRNKPLKNKLDRIVHPPVLEYLGREIASAKKARRTRIVAVEAALLYEAGAEPLFDYIIAVDAPEKLRIARVLGRDGVGRADVLRRMRAQLSPSEKSRRADFVILNDDDLPALEKNCRFLFRLLTTLSVRPSGHGKNPV